METQLMGRVTTAVTLANWDDLKAVQDGKLAASDVRRIEVADALVDTGSTTLSIPRRLIEQLGIRPTLLRPAKTAVGMVMTQTYEPVQLTIDGRDCWPEVSEVADDCTVLIGQIPLEYLDLLVDPKRQRLIGNPDHDGVQMIELY